MNPVTMLDLTQLRASLAGALYSQGEVGYREHCGAFNVLVHQAPLAVAVPETAADVQAVVRFAARNGLQVAAQRTGHNAGPLGDLRDVILIRTSRLDDVEIWPDARRARVGAGAKWAQVVPRASALGLAALHGSTPDVSVAGYALGGGVGWYARKLGLAAESVLAVDVVTADGRLRRVDRDASPELFWALRGGGGSLGVVTALELELFPIDEVYAGVLFFPLERAAEVLEAWRAWTADVPDEVTSVGRLLRFPPVDAVPALLRGRSFVVVEAVVLGDEAEANGILEPLRRLGPELDTFAMVPPAGISQLHMDPDEPLPYRGEHMLLGALDPAAIDGLVRVAGAGSAAGEALISVELRHLGGAAGTRPAGHGVLGAIDAPFALFAIGIAPDPDAESAVDASIEAVLDALAPWDTGRRYLNFAEQETDPSSFYRPDDYRLLRAVKSAFDPDDVIRSNHPIPVLD